MRIIVISDTHTHLTNFIKVYTKQPNADVYIHLGDGMNEVQTMRLTYPNSCFITVRGNCDFKSTEPEDKLLVLENKRIFLSHGHKYGVKSSYTPFISAAKKQAADIALFGHTHIPYSSYTDGMHILNPGSLEIPRRDNPKFGIVDIINGSITAYLADV